MDEEKFIGPPHTIDKDPDWCLEKHMDCRRT